MKKRYYLIILLLTCSCNFGNAQNLVPNGDFEQFTNCPYGGIFDSVLFWINPALGWGYPRYYNACHPYNDFGVPYNWSGNGYQVPHSGDAYCGINLQYISPPVDSQRDYIEVPLISPLVSNQSYHFEMYVNLSNASYYTSDDIGVFFSDSLIAGVNNWHPLPVIPQIENTSGNLFDTLTWTSVSGNYIAHGGESHLIIGNFKSDFNTTVIPVNNLGYLLHVYIDDVSLSLSTDIDEQNASNTINVYPNPVLDKLNISINNKEPSEIILYDIASRKLIQQVFINSISIPTEQLTKGIYLYEVRNKSGVIKKGKVVKD